MWFGQNSDDMQYTCSNVDTPANFIQFIITCDILDKSKIQQHMCIFSSILLQQVKHMYSYVLRIHKQSIDIEKTLAHQFCIHSLLAM